MFADFAGGSVEEMRCADEGNCFRARVLPDGSYTGAGEDDVEGTRCSGAGGCF